LLKKIGNSKGSALITTIVILSIVCVGVVVAIFVSGGDSNSRSTKNGTDSLSLAREISDSLISIKAEEVRKADSLLTPDQILAEAEARIIFASVHKREAELIDDCGCYSSNWDSLGIVIPTNSRCTYSIEAACSVCGTYYEIIAVGKDPKWGTFRMTHDRDFQRVDS
jgi:hypothetical protein